MKELYLLVLTVAAVCNSIPSQGQYVVKAYFLSDYIRTVFSYMTNHMLCYYSLSPAHCYVASWEDSRIRREVFNR